MDYEQAVQTAEAEVRRKAERKFAKIQALSEAEAKHRHESASWARIADAALYRATMYQARKIWVDQVIQAGLLERDEAWDLARLKYPIE